ncbi:hypothetical protein OL548_19215 [Lysinibacillus sp. MHQ-1]|nr:hypothetical protein OL548_19215 [Lysinibacillus sp. MHQ-1]
MRIIHMLIGLLITCIGLALLNTTMDAAIRNMMVKVYGILLLSIGVFYLKKNCENGEVIALLSNGFLQWTGF